MSGFDPEDPVPSPYYDMDHRPIPFEVARPLLEDFDARVVGRDAVATRRGEVLVSTIFTVTNAERPGRVGPLLYETVVLGGRHGGDAWTYGTREAAEAGHRRAVGLVRNDDGEGPCNCETE